MTNGLFEVLLVACSGFIYHRAKYDTIIAHIGFFLGFECARERIPLSPPIMMIKTVHTT